MLNSISQNELDYLLRKYGSLSLIELDGLLSSAIISDPNITSLKQWLNIDKINNIIFETDEQANNIITRNGLLKLRKDNISLLPYASAYQYWIKCIVPKKTMRNDFFSYSNGKKHCLH